MRVVDRAWTVEQCTPFTQLKVPGRADKSRGEGERERKIVVSTYKCEDGTPSAANNKTATETGCDGSLEIRQNPQASKILSEIDQPNLRARKILYRVVW